MLFNNINKLNNIKLTYNNNKKAKINNYLKFK